MTQTQTTSLEQMKRTLTIEAVGIIVAILVSAVSLIFGVGVFYAEVRQNSDRIGRVEPEVIEMKLRLERIDANLDFLVSASRHDINMRYGSRSPPRHEGRK